MEVENTHGVPKKMWIRWDNLARKLFNDLYEEALAMGWDGFKHPQAPAITEEQHQTVSWNSAFMAAHLLMKIDMNEIRAAEVQGAA